MKHGILILAAVAGLAVLVPMAFSASPRDPLAARVAALGKEVKALQQRDRRLTVAIAKTSAFSACDVAVTGDALQGTWKIVDQISTATRMGKTYFGPQSPVDDHGVCGKAGIIRSQILPPTTAQFEALLDTVP